MKAEDETQEMMQETPPPAEGEEADTTIQVSHKTLRDKIKPIPPPDSVALVINPRRDEKRTPPCYLPQMGDDMPARDHTKPMGPIGPWATGKVDWSPLAGLTGTRPVVDRYSITRFSPNEWRHKNYETITQNNKVLDDAMKNEYNTRNALMRIRSIVDRTQNETTENIKQRLHLIQKWKSNVGAAIHAMAVEITTMAEQRNRLKKSLLILGVPESIAKECLERRCGRPETELVRDIPEEELIKELALISEIRRLLKKTLEDVETQQIENRTARQRMEFDWGDKKEAVEIDTFNAGLTNDSTLILYRPGAVRQSPEQSTEQFWEHFSKDTMTQSEKTRQKSVKLRKALDSTLLNAARDIRSQADLVERALTTRIRCARENVERFEAELKTCLINLAETERRITSIHSTISGFDAAMKVAHTRMDARNFRPNAENCRDVAQQNLIDEVCNLQSAVTGITKQLTDAEKAKNNLMKLRSTLEREIMLKRRTLSIDQDRCMLLRSHYPSATALSGIANI